MRFDVPLVRGVLLRRYQRFLADVCLEDGCTVTVHCPNSGSLLTCAAPGRPVLLLPASNPLRRTPFTWELVHNGRCWIGIDTLIANRVAEESLNAGIIPGLAQWTDVQREVTYRPGCRFDFLLRSERAPDCFVEVKNVTLVGEDGAYCFPDAPTKRGRKHLTELMRAVAGGLRAAILFVIQRSDGSGFRPAAGIDPEYAHLLERAAAAGVTVLAWRAEVSPSGVRLVAPEPLINL